MPRFTVHRKLNLSHVDPILPPEEEMYQVEGADSFEEAIQLLDKKVMDRISYWSQVAANIKQGQQTPQVEKEPATKVEEPAQTNPPQGQVEADQSKPEEPTPPAETPAPAEAPTSATVETPAPAEATEPAPGPTPSTAQPPSA